MKTVEYWNSLYECDEQMRDAHAKMLENLEAGKLHYSKDWDLDWVIIGIALNRTHISEKILQSHGVPEGLSVKQGLAFLQLKAG